ncbi:unnamed protein product [Effrenium voratum]|nr:unnamed protein product [Effrenium voratum]
MRPRHALEHTKWCSKKKGQYTVYVDGEGAQHSVKVTDVTGVGCTVEFCDGHRMDAKHSGSCGDGGKRSCIADGDEDGYPTSSKRETDNVLYIDQNQKQWPAKISKAGVFPHCEYHLQKCSGETISWKHWCGAPTADCFRKMLPSEVPRDPMFRVGDSVTLHSGGERQIGKIVNPPGSDLPVDDSCGMLIQTCHQLISLGNWPLQDTPTLDLGEATSCCVEQGTRITARCPGKPLEIDAAYSVRIDGTEAYFDNFRVGEAVPYCKANIVRLEVDGSGFPESSCKYTLEFNDNSTSIGQEVSDKWSGMSAAADRNADLMKAFAQRGRHLCDKEAEKSRDSFRCSGHFILRIPTEEPLYDDHDDEESRQLWGPVKTDFS